MANFETWSRSTMLNLHGSNISKNTLIDAGIVWKYGFNLYSISNKLYCLQYNLEFSTKLNLPSNLL